MTASCHLAAILDPASRVRVVRADGLVTWGNFGCIFKPAWKRESDLSSS